MLSTKKTSRFRVLDSLRGFASILVVIHHFMVFNEKKLLGTVDEKLYQLLTFLSSLNYLAVLFFFVLSGFSIGYSLKGKLLASKAETNNYLYKRFRRIIPVYILALAFSLFIGFLLNKEYEPTYSATNLIGNLLFLQTSASATSYWFSPYGQNGPLWSLAYEMFFYLFLPILSFAILRYRVLSRLKILVILFLLSIISIVFNKYVLFVPFLSFLSLFIVWWVGFELAEKKENLKEFYLMMVALFFFGIATQIMANQIPSATIVEMGQGILMGLGLYLLFFINSIWVSPVKNWIKKIFNILFEQVGHGSYALYALHYPLFIYMNALGLKPSFQIIFTFVLLICCIMIEKWAIKQKFSFFNLNYMAIKDPKVG